MNINSLNQKYNITRYLFPYLHYIIHDFRQRGQAIVTISLYFGYFILNLFDKRCWFCIDLLLHEMEIYYQACTCNNQLVQTLELCIFHILSPHNSVASKLTPFTLFFNKSFSVGFA